MHPYTQSSEGTAYQSPSFCSPSITAVHAGCQIAHFCSPHKPMANKLHCVFFLNLASPVYMGMWIDTSSIPKCSKTPTAPLLGPSQISRLLFRGGTNRIVYGLPFCCSTKMRPPAQTHKCSLSPSLPPLLPLSLPSAYPAFHYPFLPCFPPLTFQSYLYNLNTTQPNTILTMRYLLQEVNQVHQTHINRKSRSSAERGICINKT